MSSLLETLGGIFRPDAAPTESFAMAVAMGLCPPPNPHSFRSFKGVVRRYKSESEALDAIRLHGRPRACHQEIIGEIALKW
jgi:hypothetical protein